MRSLLPAALLALACPLSASAAAPAKSLYFQHHDWIVACDNTLTCRAAGYATDDDSTLSVLLTRKGGPGQAIQGRLSLQPEEGQPQPKGALHLRIQQQDLGVLAPAKGEGTHSLNASQASALLSALVRDGGVSVTDGAGHRWPLSDKGAAAVLLKIDEYQGRLGTPGAVMRKGSSPESSVPAALPVPVVRKAATVDSTPDDPAFAKLAASPALRTALRATLEGDSCEGLQEADADTPLSNSPLEVRRLDAQHVLVNVPCWRAAYNSGDGYWVTRPQPPFQAKWVTSDAIDYDDGQIIAAQKGRGLGDCISQNTWTWNGTAFIATSEVAAGLCRGVPGGTWELPTLVTEIR
ncbi:MULTISPECIES: DUF1176 domain-containing protein [Stenotrophomonas]|uniref:DUF1176 domain-containing protein n=1 Tax=Stenotrophomonas maltophilia TaxID=40324 RepID=A0AAD0BT25_STEMA|nr:MULTISPECIES: DUF1176 domain-containing protein [Stenotrophomonas]AUI07468.1 DUF1176 domain-containing protein [Stenotrophomonas maltophilia]MBA2131771.1 DUF1176 domain-containing protein [Stenotrophomonas maltophilia]MBH1683840.1 DUF1176 domain-containing protein [Stenotrophomonas maltophilia]MBH1875723.1 DUF1176 domain-containing protein [Stenotrophomonas maltophilia]RIA32245.1 uncharacterized protein DUF1176 [Stenotrophomonas sp. AG209]